MSLEILESTDENPIIIMFQSPMELNVFRNDIFNTIDEETGEEFQSPMELNVFRNREGLIRMEGKLDVSISNGA